MVLVYSPTLCFRLWKSFRPDMSHFPMYGINMHVLTLPSPFLKTFLVSVPACLIAMHCNGKPEDSGKI